MKRWYAPIVSTLLLTALPLAQGWPNAGGNPARNGQSTAYGPLTAQSAWTNPRTSIIAWQPVIAGNRVFTVRQTGFPPGGEPNGSPVIAYDLATGNELWRVDIPFNTGDWTTWVLGTSNGLVYASRSGNGSSVSAVIHALDQATGATVWTSQDEIDAGFYDGVVFAPNGDLIVGSFRTIWRIRASDGTTAWSTSRNCSVSGTCGVARFGSSIYAIKAVSGGHVVERYDASSGARLYQSAVMPGFTIQQTPMVGPDGTIYINRTQNNASVDYFYAWDDTGVEFALKWRVASNWTTNAEFAVGTNGWVYMLRPGPVLSALDPSTGGLLHEFAMPWANNNVRCAVDADGRLFVSNGDIGSGRLYSFDPDLTLRWSMAVPRVNIGGPALADDGTLVIADTSNVRAFRTPSPWTELGGGIAGITGVPRLSGLGTMTANNDIALRLENALPGATSVLILGASAANLPLFGGTLVPTPDVAVAGLPIDAGGEHELTLTWPAGAPSGLGLWCQHWYADAAAVQGVAASNGLRGVTP